MEPATRDALRRRLGDTFTYADAMGRIRQRLYRLRDAGDIIALGGGVYRWADAAPADTDLIEIAERVPLATLCLETALARHGLIDAIPAAIDIAIPRGSRRPTCNRQLACTSSPPAPSSSAVKRSMSARDAPSVSTLPSARSIDIVRLRHLEGSDVAWEALRRWLRRKAGALPSSLLSPQTSLAPNPRCVTRFEVLL